MKENVSTPQKREKKIEGKGGEKQDESMKPRQFYSSRLIKSMSMLIQKDQIYASCDWC